MTIAANAPYVQFMETDNSNVKYYMGVFNENLTFSNDGGLGKFFLTQNGDMGLGTSSPDAKLEILGSNVSSGGVGGGLKISSGSSSSYLLMDNNEMGSYGASLFLNYYTANNVLLCSGASSGNVGIGTSSATQKLHVRGNRIRLQKPGSNTKYIDIRTDGNENDITSYGADLYLNADGSNIVVVQDQLKINSMPFGDYKNVQWNSSTGILGYDNSSRRYKENITDLELDSNFEDILQAKSKKYTRPGTPDRWEVGFIAEDFHDLGMTLLVEYDDEGRPDGLRYDKMVTYTVPLIAKQKEQIEALESRVQKLEAEKEQLNSALVRLSQIEKTLAKLQIDVIMEDDSSSDK